MSTDELPEDVRKLIADRIDSIPELEAILLLREDRDRLWTASDAGKRLYVSTTMAAHILSLLAGRGFLNCVGDEYRYAPESPEFEARIDALANCYSRALIAVTTAIHSKPSPSVRQFAEAFRLRKDT